MSKKGKYADILPNLKDYPLVEADRRDIVETVKAQIVAPIADDETQISPDEIRAELDNAFKSLIKVNRCQIRAAAKRAIDGVNLRPHSSDYGRVYSELRQTADDVDEWMKSMNLLLEAYTALLVEQMQAEGLMSLRLSTGQLVSVYKEPYSQVKDKVAFRKYCIDNGLENELTLAWQTMNGMTKKLLLDGEPEPTGVEVFGKWKVKLGPA